ncbi:L,D-transpeptidase family protein [Aurantimonas marina]|uniref:L,D-transpeptidase family protein n=1 Tax=Aurantimonas marina TaxID=2780508 RepID=UPI0019D2ECB7|nr:L,D-transpeptidase [Aurantimonas marina]
MKILLTASAGLLAWLAPSPAFSDALPLTQAAIGTAHFVDWQARQGARSGGAPDPFLIRLQVLLGRAHASPGVIDGMPGDNTDKAVRAYELMRGLPEDGRIDADVWTVLAVDEGEAMQIYTITKEDVAGRYVASIPEDYGERAGMEWLGYRDPAEMLAEKFHMDEDLLKLLNPSADFAKAGTTILVADPGEAPTTKVARIVVDKAAGRLVAYDDQDQIVLANPATIGSTATPSPSGTMTVNALAPEPTYSYNPKINFQQGENSEPLTLPPGPNGPVGSMWIDLSKPTYGIHGTPEPSQISKSNSNGCVRLTNWDAEALSKLVEPGRTSVEFSG